MLVRRVASRVMCSGSPDAYLVSCGMADDGRIGLGPDHVQDDSTSVATHVPFPDQQQGVRQVSCGGAHTLALMAGGSVYAFGLNDAGQCGQAPVELRSVWQPGEVLVPEDVVRVAAGFRHGMAVGKERVWIWGGDTWMPRVVPLPDGTATDVVDVVAGDGFSILVTRQGRALLCGENIWDGCGFLELSPGRNIVKASAGHFHAALCDDQGNVQLVPNVQAQLSSSRVTVANVDLSHPVRDVACGGGHTLVSLVGGGVMAWGQGDALGLGDGEGRMRPTRIDRLDGAEIVKVAAGWRHSAAIDHAGRLFAWGWGGSQGGSISLIERRGSGGGQLGLGDDCDAWEPRVVEKVRMGGLEIGNEYWRAVDVSLGINHSAFIIKS